MKIIYFTHFDLLRPTTNRISDIRFCEGFAENDCDVELVAPYVYRSYNIKRKDINRVYGLEHVFRITILPTPFWEGMTKYLNVPLLICALVAHYLRILVSNKDRLNEMVILSRDPNVLFPILQLNKLLNKNRPQVVLWAHEIKRENPRYRAVYERVDGIIGTNSAITDDISAQLGIPKDRLAISLNPVSTRQLNVPIDKDRVRRALGISPSTRLVVYTGKLGLGVTEIEYILQAAEHLPAYTFLFTGGKPEAVDHFRRICAERELSNILFTGFVNNYTEVWQYQVAADVLVSYYTKRDHLVDYNYPQKITEYMLTGNPIITPDYRATRDILTSSNAMFVDPEDGLALAGGIQAIMEQPEHARRIGEQARADAQLITFKARTDILLRFFEGLAERKDVLPRLQNVG